MILTFPVDDRFCHTAIFFFHFRNTPGLKDYGILKLGALVFQINSSERELGSELYTHCLELKKCCMSYEIILLLNSIFEVLPLLWIKDPDVQLTVCQNYSCYHQ